MKKVVLSTLTLLLLCCFGLQAQESSLESLKAMKAEKEAALNALAAEIDGIQGQIDAIPNWGWKLGGAGTLGFNINANNNWFAIANPNSSSNGLGIGFGAFANLDQEKFFWNNGLNANLNRISALANKSDESSRSVALADLLDFSSLFGYKLSDKLAVSAEAKWISSIVELDPKGAGVLDDEYSLAFNSPGQMTVSAGVTWTPITDLVVIVHPLGYQKNWPGEFISSAGAKIGATYAKEILPGVKWNSSLNAFLPYTGSGSVDLADAGGLALRTVDYNGGDLVNWLWNNGFSFTVFKGIGVGLNLGLRGDKQVADQGRLRGRATALRALTPGISDTDIQTEVGSFNISDNPVQLFWNLGLSYAF